jgi:putative ABC transport system permease protein
MTIPIVYNLRSVRARWLQALIAVLGIAGTVGVFVAVMSLARGFQATLVSSGSPSNALILRAGAETEVKGSVSLNQVRIIENAPGVAWTAQGPLVTPEVVLVAAFPLVSTGNRAPVQVRGVSNKALQVHNNVKLDQGRFFHPGSMELVVGRNVSGTYAGLSLGDSVKFGGGAWHVVGILDAGGSAFDSEVWGDARILTQIYHRPQNVFQSVTARLTSPDALPAFTHFLRSDPRMHVDVSSEVDYYARQSTLLTQLIQVLGGIIAGIMGAGAVLGALNTMHSAVAERGREIATLRALGYGSSSVAVSFVVEALLIAAAGGALGCLLVLPVNGLTTGTLNVHTFARVATAFKVTPDLLARGIVFALLMGLAGGILPAVRAARSGVASALRGQ